jgi:hypothetical protein
MRIISKSEDTYSSDDVVYKLKKKKKSTLK